MLQMIASRRIDAPLERVFDVVAHIENFRKAVPGIIDVELTSETKRGVGTRFRETRMMKGRKASTELEVTEYVADQRVRLVADEGGTVWDTVFTVDQRDGQTHLEMVMDAKPHKFMARLMNPLIKGMVQKALEADLDCVKTYCESDDAARGDGQAPTKTVSAPAT